MPSFHVQSRSAKRGGDICCLLAALLLCCAPQRDTDGVPSGPGANPAPDMSGSQSASCTGAATRCVAQHYQTCQGGTFADQTICTVAQTCDPALGCADCLPARGPLCIGDAVHACGPDGKVGPVVQTCAQGQCQSGACQCAAAGVDLIYVVDAAYDLLSFNPRNGANVFKQIGSLRCPAGDSWPAWSATHDDDPTAVPFSMSVDRSANAWVLYTSGEIFNVNVNTAKCTATKFARGQLGFQLFGMGFSSDTMGSGLEHLFIAGGAAGSPGLGDLGSIAPATLAATAVAALPVNGTGVYGPELTGTANGDLYAYFPGKQSYVAQFNKATGELTRQWSLKGLTGTVMAWAFAQWGGQFYIFVTTQDGAGNNHSTVHLFDPATATDTVILQNLPYAIVGAGVSTCAPATLG